VAQAASHDEQERTTPGLAAWDPPLPEVIDQQDLAARLSGGLWLFAAVTTLIALALPGTDSGNVWIPIGLALIAAALGVARARLVPAHRWSPALAHGSVRPGPRGHRGARGGHW
jgi:hypothetical protein